MKIETDLIFTCQDYSSTNLILNELKLETNSVLIICTEIFFQRFIQHIYDIVDAFGNTTEKDFFDKLEKDLERKYITFGLVYNGKKFNFTFIIMTEEEKIINNPTHGPETYRVGFKEIKI